MENGPPIPRYGKFQTKYAVIFFLNLGTFLDKDFGFCAIEYVQ